MTRTAVWMSAIAFSSLVALSGCYESPDVTVYSPGEYKGKEDPLLDTARQDKFNEQLQDRFAMGQHDR